MSYNLDKDPRSLSQQELASLAENLMAYMYLENATDRESYWNPDKKINGSVLVELVDEILAFHNLRPIPENPKDWSPKKKRKYYL